MTIEGRFERIEALFGTEGLSRLSEARVMVVGLGGVSSAEDVLEMMLAGASAVEVGAANLVQPYACRDIIAALPGTMDKYGIENLNEIIGGAL